MLIRDGYGTVFNEVENPAVVFNKDSGVYYKVGEYELLKVFHEDVVNGYNEQGFVGMANSLTLLELPKDQEVVDKIFQNSGYVKLYYEKEVLNKN